MSWLLGLETDRSVDGLSNSICHFLCSRPNSERDGVSSTSSSVGERIFRTRSVAEALTIGDIIKNFLLLQEEENEVTRLDEQNRRGMPNMQHTKYHEMVVRKCKDGCTTVIMVLMMSIVSIRQNTSQ
jgi:hypothetical protein